MTEPQAPEPQAPELDLPLVLRGARYRYAGARTWALDGVDLTLQPGEIHGLVGANDAGKSTLCLVGSGLAPTAIGGRLEGSVRLAGRETRELRPHEAAEQCGILFQNPLTQLSGTAQTVWEELAFGPSNLGLDPGEIVVRVEAALATLQIADLASRDPTRLSGGQAQLVALAAVLTLRPTCLVLDEPTSQLDPEGTRLVGEAVRRLVGETGGAVLLVEHKTALVEQIADTVAVLDGGRIVADGPAREVLADPILVELGIDPPPGTRLRRALVAGGIDPAAIERVIAALADESEATE